LGAAKDKLPHRLYLFYANRRPEVTAFLEELLELERENPNYKLIATMNEIEKSAHRWQGETGFITKEMLSKYLNELEGPIYYIAGPPAMVTAMQKMLNEAGINDDDIRTESFSGYS
jgi:ferredoxin-NADP reductase